MEDVSRVAKFATATPDVDVPAAMGLVKKITERVLAVRDRLHMCIPCYIQYSI